MLERKIEIHRGRCISWWSTQCQHHRFLPTPGVQGYTPLYTHPLIRQQNTGLINQCAVTIHSPIPPMATIIYIHIPKWPPSNQRVLPSYPLLGVQLVTKNPLFCLQKTALPSCPPENFPPSLLPENCPPLLPPENCPPFLPPENCPPFLPSLPALPSCPPFLPSLPALPSCPPFLPSLPALPSCPPFLPSLPALPSCPPFLPSFPALPS